MTALQLKSFPQLQVIFGLIDQLWEGISKIPSEVGTKQIPLTMLVTLIKSGAETGAELKVCCGEGDGMEVKAPRELPSGRVDVIHQRQN